MDCQSFKDIEIIKLRTRTMLMMLMQFLKCTNVNQFGAWVNRRSERLGWPDTQSSNKWYHLIDGKIKRAPVGAVRMLDQLFGCAEKYYDDGPSNLWRALWGDTRDQNVLWKLCRTRICTSGNWTDDSKWSYIESNATKEKAFRQTLFDFEADLFFATESGTTLRLRHLTEAVALYRLHRALNRLAVSDVDGVGAYRCVIHCLETDEISSELKSYGAYDIVRSELEAIEHDRLTTEQAYFASVGIDRHSVVKYARNPLPFFDNEARWEILYEQCKTRTLVFARAVIPLNYHLSTKEGILTEAIAETIKQRSASSAEEAVARYRQHGVSAIGSTLS
ncbi:hypothetical protein PQR72_05160 [Paraburkholderia madseniana]|uniref:hypothetical protein n=1 Tax=Paraburkholderia madseniana TaxID=2599607 RepID=UPI0015C56AC5|nr:hypothetical protein [Paraburkholderia madseniana]NPT62944.1 hypothetical protein [Paraburkholderia madseniana]